MGVDLRLIPVDHESDKLAFGHTLLSLERRRELWADIENSGIEKNFNKPFSSWLGDNYGTETINPYGSPLTYATVEDLWQFDDNSAVNDNSTNRAVWEYIKALPKEQKIILYWH